MASQGKIAGIDGAPKGPLTPHVSQCPSRCAVSGSAASGFGVVILRKGAEVQRQVAICSASQGMWTAEQRPGPGLSPGRRCLPVTLGSGELR